MGVFTIIHHYQETGMLTNAHAHRHIFGISSSYQTGSTGRSAIWVWASSFACLAILVASRNPEAIPRPSAEDQAEEETALLSDPAS